MACEISRKLTVLLSGGANDSLTFINVGSGDTVASAVSIEGKKMIRIIGFYRWSEAASFDHEYYHSEHMRLTKEALTPHGLLRLESDRYLSPKPPVAGEIIAASNAYFPSVEVAQAALAAVGAVLMADLPRYTNLQPEIRFSLVTAHS